MPLKGVSSEVARRFATLNAFIGWLDGEETAHTPPGPPLPSHVRACKGLVFVHLYAIWEYALNSISIAANQFISAQAIPQKDLAIPLLPMAVASKIQSLRDCAIGDTWRKGAELFSEAFLATPVVIQDTAFPKDGTHYRFAQLETLCYHLCVVGSPDTIPSLKWIVDEAVGHRNNIAHGLVAPEDVGSRFPISELKIRSTGMNALITNAIGLVTQQLTAKGGLNR